MIRLIKRIQVISLRSSKLGGYTFCKFIVTKSTDEKCLESSEVYINANLKGFRV